MKQVNIKLIKSQRNNLKIFGHQIELNKVLNKRAQALVDVNFDYNIELRMANRCGRL